jgi:hypothetical protein
MYGLPLVAGTAFTIRDRASAAISPPFCIWNASLIYAGWCLKLKGSFATDSDTFNNSSSGSRCKTNKNNNPTRVFAGHYEYLAFKKHKIFESTKGGRLEQQGRS